MDEKYGVRAHNSRNHKAARCARRAGMRFMILSIVFYNKCNLRFLFH